MSRILKMYDNQISFGYSSSHKAVDIVGKGYAIDDIVSHSDGIVTWIQTGLRNDTSAKGNASYGNCVKIFHPDSNKYTLYAHLESVYVLVNQKVSKGQLIGRMGNTGCSYGVHLHFEIRDVDNSRLNPTAYINANLPGEKATSSKTYIVDAGDTLSSIAFKHGLTLAQLIELNPQIKNINMIYPGDAITVSQSDSKTNDEIADEVIQGLWGNGEERVVKLTAAGYDYTKIQSIVNSKFR